MSFIGETDRPQTLKIHTKIEKHYNTVFQFTCVPQISFEKHIHQEINCNYYDFFNTLWVWLQMTYL
jgi:hypothetical protein